MVNVVIQKASEITQLPENDDFETWVHGVMNNEFTTNHQGELTIRIVDTEESQQLNATYRHQNKPTNVLAFPYHNDECLGDLVLCAPIVVQEAMQQQKTLEAHWAHLIVHGCLHLCGYDHVDPEDAMVMETCEIKILKRLGFDNPYEMTREDETIDD